MPRTRAELCARLWELLGHPDGGLEELQLVCMILVAWADESLHPGEVRAIREALAAGDGLPRRVSLVEKLLARNPGPYFEHRVLDLVRVTLAGLKADEISGFSGRLDASAEAVENVGFRLLKRLFDPDDQTTAEVSRLHQALQTALPAPFETLLGLVLGPCQGKRKARDAAALPSPYVEFEMVVEPDAFTQVRCLRFPGGDRFQGICLAAVEQFQFQADLDEKRIVELHEVLAGRPETELWTALHLETASLARPADPAVVDSLVARLEGRLGHRVHRVSLAQLSDVEDHLAKNHGFGELLMGNIRQIRVDRQEVRRSVPPGAFACSRASLLPPVLASRPMPSIPGLVFRVLVVKNPAGESLALASPATTGKPTPEYVHWLAHFLPLIHDPLSTPLFDYEADTGHAWMLELRSGFPDAPEKLPPAVLPPGRALVVTPWAWLRLARALGLSPA